jgi:hypothetical protein
MIGGLLMVSLIDFSQAVKDSQVIPVAVNLNQDLRMTITNGGNIEFVLNTIDDYRDGLSADAAPSGSATFIGADNPGNTLALNNVGFTIVNAGIHAFEIAGGAKGTTVANPALVVALGGSSESSSRWREPVNKVLLELPDGAPGEVTNIARIFTRHLHVRSGTAVVSEGTAHLTVRFLITPELDWDSYRISGEGAEIVIASGDAAGLLHGAGRLLCESRFDQGGFGAGTWRGTDEPGKAFRAMYWATHFGNTYHWGDIDTMVQYVEDMGLMGYNRFITWFDPEFYSSPEDPGVAEYMDRMCRYLKAAQDVGMKVGIIDASNMSYGNYTPEQLRATRRNGTPSRREICPSVPGGQELILELHRDIYRRILNHEIEISHVCIWGYDSGGCYCDLCAPWEDNGYMVSARAMAGLVREMFGEECTTSVSTWGCPPNSWFDLWMENDPEWLDYFVYVLNDAKKYRFEHERLPDHIAALNFPDICNGRRATVWLPRGGYGANPVPGLIQEFAVNFKEQDGGFPYSEGIWEDLNKQLIAYLYWNPEGDVTVALRQYIASHFSPEVVDDVVEAIGILEENSREAKSIQNDEEFGVIRNTDYPPISALTAYDLMRAANARLPEAARSSWRWRLLYLRAQIDAGLHWTQGALEGEMLQSAFDELRDIYQYVNKPQRYVGVPMQNW